MAMESPQFDPEFSIIQATVIDHLADQARGGPGKVRTEALPDAVANLNEARLTLALVIKNLKQISKVKPSVIAPSPSGISGECRRAKAEGESDCYECFFHGAVS